MAKRESIEPLIRAPPAPTALAQAEAVCAPSEIRRLAGPPQMTTKQIL